MTGIQFENLISYFSLSTIGCLITDKIKNSKQPNCEAKFRFINNLLVRSPYLYLVATRDIQPNEEICYDFEELLKRNAMDEPFIKLFDSKCQYKYTPSIH